MLFSFWRGKIIDPGEAARRRHEAWLNSVLKSRRALPRIPTRKVSEGGFDPVTRTLAGRMWTAEWWDETLALEELDIPRGR